MTHSSLRSSLLIPDASTWHGAVGYCWEARAALINAYHALQHVHDDPEAYRRAYAAVIPYRARTVSLQQRMNIGFVLAQAYANEQDFGEATTSAEAALEVANLLGDQLAQVELHYLRGSLADAQLQLREASTHYMAGLKTLRALGTDNVPADADYELTLLIRVTAMSFELARYDEALDHLFDAHSFRTIWLPDSQEDAARITWLGAQLLRWKGELDMALTAAMAASDLLLHSGTPVMLGRIQTIIAETALDRAQAFSPDGLSRDAMITLAHPFARRAIKLAHDSDDQIGEQLARLALLRIDCLRAMPTNRIPALESILRRAKRTGDPAVLGRAFAALGDELAGRDEYESARHCYQLAWRHLEEHGLLAMAQRPRKAFFQLGEMREE